MHPTFLRLKTLKISFFHRHSIRILKTPLKTLVLLRWTEFFEPYSVVNHWSQRRLTITMMIRYYHDASNKQFVIYYLEIMRPDSQNVVQLSASPKIMGKNHSALRSEKRQKLFYPLRLLKSMTKRMLFLCRQTL